MYKNYMMSILNLRRKVIMNRTARKQKKNRISNVILEFIEMNKLGLQTYVLLCENSIRRDEYRTW